MKMLLILWAIGLSSCEKLDRTYLPPPGSVSAGGYPEDLNLPLEFPKDKPISLKPEDGRTFDSPLSSKYPNIALGIDRQGPFVTSSPKFTSRPEISISKNIYNIPTTTNTYDLSGASTFSPLNSYESTVGPMTTISQGYSPISSANGPNLSYDQYLLQQKANQNSAPETIPNESGENVLDFSNKNVGFPSGRTDVDQTLREKLPFGNVNKYVTISGQNNSVGSPEFQSAGNNPTRQYGGDLDSISEVRVPTPKPYDSFSTPRVPVNFDNINVNSQEFNGPSKPGISSSNNYGIPYNTNNQIQRIQAEGDRNAVILNYKNVLTPEGFAYSFDTSNGIHADEHGTAIDGVKAKGSYSFTGDDGKIYSIEYTADENGFLPRGDHLPTAPPIPNAILRSIEQAQKNKALGIVDDGSYSDAKYGHRRYQGLMDRMPQNQYNNIFSNQPAMRENDETSSFGNKIPTYQTNNGGVLDGTFVNTEPGASYNTLNKSKTVEIPKEYPNRAEDDKDLATYYDGNQPNGNRLFSSEIENFNRKSFADPKNKLGDDTIQTTFGNDEDVRPNSQTKSELLNPTGFINVLPKEYKGQKDYELGYDYSRPQNTFNSKDQNNMQPISFIRNDESNLENEGQNDRVKGIPAPNATFKFQSQEPVVTSQVRGYNDPSSISKDSNIKLDFPAFYKEESGDIKTEKIIPENVFSALERIDTSSTVKPYYYQSFTSDVDGKPNTYPSSTFTSQYSMSTTPLPSDVSSTIIPSTNNFNYFVTTPATSRITSTFRPSVTSVQPNSRSRITSRPFGNIGRTSGPETVENSRISTIKPNSFGQKLFTRPEQQSRPNIPIIKTGFSEDTEPEFVVSTDPRTRVSSRPENISTGGFIGENFTGPKQSQKFDPERGYFY